MSSKNHIIKALNKSSLHGHKMPTIKIAERLDDLVAQFEANLKLSAGTLQRVTDLVELQQKVHQLIADGQQVISLVEEIEANRAIPESPYSLDDIDFAVIEAQLGVAENGAIWFKQHETGHRAIPFICENLLVILRNKDLLANMHLAVQTISLDSGKFGVFIAGPSKTSDIEQSLVIGAHGACTLNVYLVH